MLDTGAGSTPTRVNWLRVKPQIQVGGTGGYSDVSARLAAVQHDETSYDDVHVPNR